MAKFKNGPGTWLRDSVILAKAIAEIIRLLKSFWG